MNANVPPGRGGRNSSNASELERMISRYPDVSPFVILKLDMIRRGAVLTPRAMDEVQSDVYRFEETEPFRIDFEGRRKDLAAPGSILLRDATNVYINYGDSSYTDPYLIDRDDEDGVFTLIDGGVEIDTVDFVPRPKFFGKRTSAGTPMGAVAYARTQKLNITAYRRCRLWESGHQCKFCAFFTDTKNGTEGEVNAEDIRETVGEAFREPGRFSEIQLSGGMDYGGKETFDDEVDRYVRVLQAIGRNFEGRFSGQLMAPAYTKKQLKRLRDETGLTSYCPNIEVWDEEKSKWLCPGKNSLVGRREWIERTLDAVEIFGKGFVSTQIVAGAELASPYGFKSVDEALESNFQACEFYAKHGVAFLSAIWRPHPASVLGRQPMPPLDYYVRLARGLKEIREGYGVSVENENYKRCGNHPDTDLERAD
jgi:hypothetical protein